MSNVRAFACARTARWLALAAALLAVAAAGATYLPASAQAVAAGDCNPAADWPANNAAYASEVANLVNQHRAGKGLVKLNISPTLTGASVWKARHMAKYEYMAHDDPAPPLARTTQQRVEACGFPPRGASAWSWGENIAYGYQTPSDVVNAWLNSPGHRANIENGSFRVIGVGAARSTNGTWFWAQVFGYPDDSGGGSTGSAPTVSLTSTPSSSTTSTSASFSWSTTGTVSSTTCSLDGATPTSCSSPKSYSALATGTHTFRVTVSNAYASASASYTWTIGSGSTTSGAPTVRLTTKPGSWTSATNASFSWSTTGTISRTTCSLDGGAPVDCSSPKAYSGLATGRHTFRVTVSNSYGSATASYSWTIW